MLDPLSPISAQDPTVKASGSLDSSGPRLFLGLLVSHDLDTYAERCWGFCSIPHLGLVSHGYTEVVHLREATRG